MKFVKLSIFALAMGFFVVSCGNSQTDETTDTDSTTIMAPEPVAPAPTPMDTTTAMPVDTTVHTDNNVAQ